MRRQRSDMDCFRVAPFVMLLCIVSVTSGFVPTSPSASRRQSVEQQRSHKQDLSRYSVPISSPRLQQRTTSSSASSTTLNVWWFGGTETAEPTDQDSCELVAVRIERTSSNSRRIYGEIVVPVPLQDVWAILTDYDRLSVHVPNLVESKILQARASGEPGDGQYNCRLYQKGAQKIIGFEFGASVTMDMQEALLNANQGQEERRITFKCTDSFFFNEFDGEWHVKERVNDMGQLESLLSYVVDVRPKGPVPVGPLEWRIREDVPTNLRAVKKASMLSGYEGVMSTRQLRNIVPARSMAQQKQLPLKRLTRINVNWEPEETMATYLNLKSEQ
ncbi:hypothetical protein MPSEU_000236400 [Mayamaea pseudoterrestris]|nr:hypothetical protein MPSEU_000236400 [Mayamaea pseudoterrestris]